MSARFAGSRSLDERRRRRIAGDWERSVEVAGTTDLPQRELPSSLPENALRKKVGRKPSRRLPLRRIISPRFWKHGVVAFFLAAVGVGILAAGWFARALGESYGPAIEELVQIPDGRLVRGYGGLLLFLASQLALLIWWVRSRSHNDFSGRYRIWSWTAVIGFVFSASVSLGLHHVWSRTLGFLLAIDFSRAETWCWLAPAVGCGSVLWRDLRADMQDCRGSTFFLRLALVGWSAAVLQLLGVGAMWTGSRAPLFISAAALFGHYCLLISMLLHARFVIFVSAEPPELHSPMWKKVFRTATLVLVGVLVGWFRLLLFRKRHSVTAVADRQTEADNTSQKDDGGQVKSPQGTDNVESEDNVASDCPAHLTTHNDPTRISEDRTQPGDACGEAESGPAELHDDGSLCSASGTAGRQEHTPECAPQGDQCMGNITTEHQRETSLKEGQHYRHDSAHAVPQPRKLSKRERRRRKKQRLAHRS